MKVRWTRDSFADLNRLSAFAASRGQAAETEVIELLVTAPDRLLIFPRLGPRISEFAEREIRRLILADYEMRYEVDEDVIVILRIWHGREYR